MHLTWHEAIVKNDRLIIQWSVREKLLRTFYFALGFTVVAGTAFLLLQTKLHEGLRWDATAGNAVLQDITLFAVILAVTVFLYGCYAIWFRRQWLLDKERNALLRGGWRKVADLDEFARFVGKREKRGRNIVFVVVAERDDGTSESLAVMDQEHTDRVGCELARFTHLGYSPR